MNHIIYQKLTESIKVKERILQDNELIDIIERLAFQIVECIQNHGKLIVCGNGGSASDAMHFSSEIIGRFQKEREPWPALALNANMSTITAIANDYGYEEVFARQAEALVTDKDIFIGFSTSGNSENVYKAVVTAQNKGAVTAALLGKNGGKIGAIVDYPIIIPSSETARIQESHITIIHIICEIVEYELSAI